MKYAILMLSTLAIILLDYHCVDVIVERGGFHAWMQTNCFWSVALMYLVCFNIMYVIGCWVFYEIVKEDRK